MAGPTRLTLSRVAVLAGSVLLVGYVAFPILWLARLSILPETLLIELPPAWLFTPSLSGYREVLTLHPFFRYLQNSLVVAVCSSAGAIAIGLPAAYSFVRFRYHGRETLSLAVLCVHVMPPIAMIIPLFVIYSRLGLLDTRLGLIVTHISLTLPLSVWLLRGFVLRVPVELEEAAQVDGCGRLEALWRVVIPIMAPGIAATAVLTFLYSWNDFIYAVILTGRGARTLPVMISGFITERAVYWDRVAAAGMLVLLPTAILGVAVQRYLATGLAAGAVKG